MSQATKQRLKLFYLMEIFSAETDDEHMLTLAQIIEKLKAYGVNVERKTLYQDFDILREYGFDIVGVKAQRNFYYHIGNRNFELPELKLLVDSVQAAKFITQKKSNALIRKLEGMVSKYEAQQLQRQVIISGRVKAMNESIYFNVDKLHEAIGKARQITFQYYRWNIKKEMELRNDGKWYRVSPWSLMWDDENYYLVGFDADDKKIKHYRVDKMMQIELVDKRREGREQFKAFNMPKYTKSLFGMFGGEELQVTLEAENEMVGILIDRFGQDIPINQVDDNHFRTVVNVAVSDQFLGWIMALDEGVKIVAPEKVLECMKQKIKLLNRVYEG